MTRLNSISERSFSGFVDDSVDLASSGGVHVIEEIEEIRELIEEKSRDISLRESVLFKSVSQAHRLVEQLAANLQANAEKAVEERFERQAETLNRLIEKIDRKLKIQDQFVRKWSSSVKQKLADVPPPSQPPVMDRLLAEMNSASGRVVAATYMCVVGQTGGLSSEAQRFATTALLDWSFQILLQFFHQEFIRIPARMDLATTETCSKFALLKRTVLLKRLGVNEASDRGRMEVVLEADFLGSDSLIEMEFADDQLRELWVKGYKVSSSVVTTPPLQIFADPQVQSSLALSLGGRVKHWRGKIAQVLIAPLNDPESVLLAVRVIRKHLRETSDLPTLATVLFLVLTLDRRRLITEVVGRELGSLLKELANNTLINKLINWKQGIWFMLDFLLQFQGTPATLPSVLGMALILEKVTEIDKSCLQIWKPFLLNSIQQGCIDEQVLGPIKSLIRLV